jgi:hypothetical protein
MRSYINVPHHQNYYDKTKEDYVGGEYLGED